MSTEEKVDHINNLLARSASQVFSDQVASNSKLLMKIPAFRKGLARSSLENAMTTGAGLRTLEGAARYAPARCNTTWTC